MTEAFKKTGEAITQAATKVTSRKTEATDSSEDIDKKDEGSTVKGATEEMNKLHFPNINMPNADN